MITHARLFFAAALVAAGAGSGCLADKGERCRIDSDCGGGLVCGFDGVCSTFAAVSATFDAQREVDVISCDTGGGGDTVAGDTAGCRAVAGVFDAGAAPCPAAPEVRTVVGLQILDEGGLAQLASVANQVLANGFANGEITMELRIDGELAAGCPSALAWVLDPDEDINADCTPVYSDTMPLVIPNLVRTAVKEAQLDPDTGILRGIVDKDALLASMDEALRGVGDQLIAKDVDTDCDEVPDHSSAIIQVYFEGDLPEE